MNQLVNYFLKFSNEKGLTLIEVLLTTSILVYFSLLLINLSSSKLYLKETANAIVSDIRSAQTKTISSVLFDRVNGNSPAEPDGIPDIVCGYGVHRISDTTYSIYVAPSPNLANNNDCSTLNRNYTTSGNARYVRDEVLVTKTLFSNKLVFKNLFTDVFFEPPNPLTYINNNSSLSNGPARITIGPSSATCSSTTCMSVCVYPSGVVEAKAGDSC